MQQLNIDFAASNKASIERQIGTLIEYLSEGRTINFIQAREMGIGFLNSRIPNVKEKGIYGLFKTNKDRTHLL